MLLIKDIITHLETVAPPAYQEDYDNAGLIVGDPGAEVKGVLVCLDALEEVVEEAVRLGCNLVVAHHPIVFKGLKKLSGQDYVTRTVVKAIKNDVAIYAAHTNLDAVYRNGVNGKIAERLGLTNTKILAPKRGALMKLTTFAPTESAPKVLKALHAAGAGRIGDYKDCSFSVDGVGAFTPTGGANPFVGSLGEAEKVAERRIEVVFPAYMEGAVLKAMRAAHPYEAVAYYLHRLENEHAEVGAGLVGDLPTPQLEDYFFERLKERMGASFVRHTRLSGKLVQKIAVCGGAGSFLLSKAIAAGADVFVTSDFKYHEFFDADGKIIIADIGHYESEQYTIPLLVDIVKKKYENMPVFSTKIVTNPVKYL